MKTVYLILPILLFQLCYSAEGDTVSLIKRKKVEHQLSINTTFFIKQIISLSNSNLQISPYIVGYKCFPSKHHGFRFSVGGSFSSRKNFPDSTFVNITSSNSLDYRAGYEYRHNLGKLWTFFGGMDLTNTFTFNRARANSNADIVTTAENTFAVGGGPVTGIQINVHRRISLFTEVAFYYSYAYTKRKINSINFPELNVNKVSNEEHKGAFLLPTSIYFVFRF